MTGRVRLSQILRVFGWIGLTSLGGGRSVYFHSGLVEKRRWITNHEFIQERKPTSPSSTDIAANSVAARFPFDV